MPRYTIGDQDLADLTAYLRQLGTEHAPGTSATAIRVGVLLPLAGPMAAQSAAVRAGGSRGLVFWGDAGTARLLLDQAARQQWTPSVLASSILLDGNIGIAHGTLHLVAPPLIPGLFRPGRARFQPAAGGADRAMQMAAFAAAEVFIAGLEMTGRELSRPDRPHSRAGARRRAPCALCTYPSFNHETPSPDLLVRVLFANAFSLLDPMNRRVSAVHKPARRH